MVEGEGGYVYCGLILIAVDVWCAIHLLVSMLTGWHDFRDWMWLIRSCTSKLLGKESMFFVFGC